jgi:hypothetical protein
MSRGRRVVEFPPVVAVVSRLDHQLLDHHHNRVLTTVSTGLRRLELLLCDRRCPAGTLQWEVDTVEPVSLVGARSSLNFLPQHSALASGTQLSR